MAIYKNKNAEELFVVNLIKKDTVFQTEEYGDVLVTAGNYAVFDGETGKTFQHGLTNVDLDLYWEKVDE